MEEFDNLEDVANVLGDGGPHNPDVDYKTVKDLVDDLVALGNTPEVLAYHDDHLGLKDSLSSAFLECSLGDTDKPEFEDDKATVLEQANRIIHLSQRELTDEDREDIREDQISRGQDPDD